MGWAFLDACLENNDKPYIALKMVFQQENIRTDPEKFKAFWLQHHEIESHPQQKKNSFLMKTALLGEDCCYEERLHL